MTASEDLGRSGPEGFAARVLHGGGGGGGDSNVLGGNAIGSGNGGERRIRTGGGSLSRQGGLNS